MASATGATEGMSEYNSFFEALARDVHSKSGSAGVSSSSSPWWSNLSSQTMTAGTKSTSFPANESNAPHPLAASVRALRADQADQRPLRSFRLCCDDASLPSSSA